MCALYDRVYTLSLHLNNQTLEHNNCDKNIDTGGLKYLPHQRHITSAAGCVFVPLIPLLHGWQPPHRHLQTPKQTLCYLLTHNFIFSIPTFTQHHVYYIEHVHEANTQHVHVTPAQLMRSGIGQNTSCTVGDFVFLFYKGDVVLWLFMHVYSSYVDN